MLEYSPDGAIHNYNTQQMALYTTTILTRWRYTQLQYSPDGAADYTPNQKQFSTHCLHQHPSTTTSDNSEYTIYNNVYDEKETDVNRYFIVILNVLFCQHLTYSLYF